MSSKAVNHPMDPKQRDQDIATKLQLYGIYRAFANGKLPSNKQCDIALNSAINSTWLTKPSSDLSEEGRTLVKDLRDVIEQAKLLFLSKNDGEYLQEFIWDAQHLTAEDFQRLEGPVSKEEAKQHASQAAEGFKSLGTLLITNGEFRKLLSDAVTLFRDIAGDAAAKAATTIKPDEQQLAQIDQPAEANVWHEKPNLSRDQVKAQFKQQVDKFKPASKKDANDAAEAATDAAMGDRQKASMSQVDARAGGAAAASQLRQAASDNVPDETKTAANEYSRRTKEFLSSKMPQERRDQLIWRLKKMVVEIQGHSDYQQAIETLLTLAETYGAHSRGITQQGTGAVKGARANDHLSRAETNLRTLIERFANSTSTDDFFDSLNNIYRDADQDPELKGWFKHVDSYIRKCLQEQGFIMQEAANEEWDQLYDKGRFLLRERYRNHTDRIVDEIKFLGTQFDQDPQNKAFANAVEKLFKDLGQDVNGKATFKPHLLKDIANVILPEIFTKVRYVPIPRIEVSDPAVDMVVENLCIESDNLMPNVFELGSDNYWRWGRKRISNKYDHKIMISCSGIQADIRDVAYYVKKKQGFPSLTDTGVMDLFLGGEGFSFRIVASKAQESDRHHLFKADKITVNVKNLDIKLKKSKHKLLFTLFKPMLFNVIRPALTKVLEKEVRDAFEKADGFAYQVQTEAKRAQEATRENPEEAPNIFSRYADAIQKTLTEKKKQAEAIAQRDTKVQVAVTHHDALFQDIKLPGGITNKATEFKEMAAKGDRWQSPVFDLGAAAPSKEVPTVAAVTRKPHTTADGTIRERPQGQTNGTTATNGATNGTTATNGNFKTEVDQAFATNGTPATGSLPGTLATDGRTTAV